MSASIPHYAPEFKIEIDGIDEYILREWVISVKVTEELNSAAQFSITLNDQFVVDQKKFVWLDNSNMQPGNKITIHMGYAGELTTLLESAKIESVVTSGFSQSAAPTLTITGHDSSKDGLNERPKVPDGTTSLDLTGSDIVKMLASNAGLTVEINLEGATEFPTKITKNPSNTYGAILQDRAKGIGFDYFVSRGIVYFINSRKPESPDMTFEWGKDLIKFTPRINTSDLVPGVKVSASSRTSSKPITAEASTGDEDTWDDGIKPSELANKIWGPKKEPKEISPSNISSQEEAEARAKAELNSIGDKLIEGTGSIVGTPELQVGKKIKLDGLGTKFSGVYFVTKVENQISKNGYTTSFSVRKNTLNEE